VPQRFHAGLPEAKLSYRLYPLILVPLESWCVHGCCCSCYSCCSTRI